MADEPPQAGVMFADLLGDVRDGWLLASSTTIASNRSVNPLPVLAHGTGTACTPWAGHVTRGTPA